MSTLDNILRSLVVRSGGKASSPLKVTLDASLEAVAKQQIQQLVLGTVIGPDERYEDAPTNRDRITRNELRAEQRKEAEDL